MLKSSIILCLLGMTFAGNSGYDYPQAAISAPHHTGSGHIKTAQHASAAAPQHYAPKGGYERSFYYFNAPEDQFDQSEAFKKLAQSTKATQRVIFIKNPENRAYENALLNLARNAVEQPKEHIYVLNREPDYAGLARKFQAVQQARKANNKPQVNFVKYRTSDDAHNAQQSITQQYGGNSGQISHGAAPVLNFAGAGGGNVNRGYLAPDATPVEKNYAKNFLPSGNDVVPGSSYIPLVVRS